MSGTTTKTECDNDEGTCSDDGSTGSDFTSTFDQCETNGFAVVDNDAFFYEDDPSNSDGPD